MNSSASEQSGQRTKNRAAAQTQLLLTTETLVGGGALLLLFIVGDAFHFKALNQTLAEVLFGWSGLPAIILLGHSYYRSRKEARRGKALYEAALDGDTGTLPLFEPQPVPDAAALPLPYTFKLRRNWRGIAAYAGVSVLGLWVFMSIVTIQIVAPDNLTGWLLLTTGLAVLITAIPFLAIAMMPHQRLEVTESGLFFREGIGPSTLRWEDITLFIISPGVRKDKPPGRYELVGAGYSWFVQRPSHQRLFQLDRPPLPYDEYDQQMDALLSVITAKTGLPLYDLR